MIKRTPAARRGTPQAPAHQDGHRSSVAVGAEMDNVRSGEHFVWLATRDSTGGAYCEFELFLSPTAKVPAPHRHPRQEERFTVLDGALAFRRGSTRSTVRVGEEIAVPADVAHSWGTAGGTPARVRVRLTPALDIEDYFATYCAIATAGKAGPVGLPRNVFQLAVLLDAYRAEFAFAFRWQEIVVGPVLSVVAAWGRRRGYRPYWP